ncbi:MAG: gliding motility protein GldN [Tannerellaceae bacterium]|jgi:gliding motility associated protien GldN|nr:gliding motility protein GldN [Tannerellaceae bacterium]
MKRFYFYCILVLVSPIISPVPLFAQNNTGQQQERRTPVVRTGERETAEKESGLPELTIRAKDMNDRMTQEIGNARWMRVIYREIDMTKEQNAPLYYPVRPLNNTMNLFSSIFRLMSEGKLTAYEYIDGYEVFDDEHVINFREGVLDRAYIYYEEAPVAGAGEPALVINESDVPSADVLAYYVKEAWYFDQNNSVFDVKTLALCPILTTTGDLGEQRLPLFWLPYENIRPYITNSPIMTSDINNAKTFTIDDYFRRRMFDGEIIKTENLLNKTMREYYPEPDSLALAQKAVENQLETFRQSLYWQPDSAQTDPKQAKKAARATARKQAAAPSATQKETQPKAAPAAKAERSAPVRSVRRR